MLPPEYNPHIHTALDNCQVLYSNSGSHWEL